ncbi:MAG: 1-(5-phosphoribosyl)-5-amino-4-imidazole-carboxylate carboxylase, partial [Candidatus Omnitrophica bacterium]|nr:1-(5-phosphoribosyl)-5-amino-4-imidazole-carboxylate carboxylase [Candidatus Omnitrophota bacterium]
MVGKKGFSDLGFAKIDIDRFKRRGFPEVVYCPGKTDEQIAGIIRELLRRKQPLLLTRLEESRFASLKKRFPKLEYNPLGKIAFQGRKPVKKNKFILLVTAGTSDIPVAEEAYVTLKVMGERVVKLYDVGVAGCHRLGHNIKLLRNAAVIIVIAGMEGALASLISG